ncbi:hypothetical protein ABZ532_28055 [Streptomyces sp. NPDC019396]|uniref:hypothetical protein n=1 Tax=Streptomyces sp. NPDC019396 TaxID=3154687 RepID=UPI0033F0251E
MLTFDNIVHAPVSQLKEAVDDWSEMVTRLKKLAEDARRGMKAKADKADWEGVNAGVGRQFIAKSAKECEDAVAEARGIHRLLAEGYAAFKHARDELVSIRDDEAPRAGVHVNASGKVGPRHSLEHNDTARRDPDYERLLHQERAAVVSWQKRIDAIVETCDDIDQSLNRALTANLADGQDFTAPKYTSLDMEEAARAAALAAKGKSLSNAELAQLNELLKDNHASKVFTRNFFSALGPQKTLEFYGQMADSVYPDDEVDKARLSGVKALQQNLGLSLATASHDAGFAPTWSAEFRKLGTEQLVLEDRGAFSTPRTAYGYQLLGGILRYGNYDPKFLNPIAEHVVQLHAKNPAGFDTNGVAFSDTGPYAYNPSGLNGAGFDPVVSVLEALGHSPEASKQFFSAEPTLYNEDGTVKGGTPDLGKNADGEEIGNYLDYFANEDYKAHPDVEFGAFPKGGVDDTDYVSKAFGHALESATLGYPWDAPDPKVARDETSVGIMEEVVSLYGEDAGLLKEQEPMAESLGRMGAGYINDINWGLDGGDEDSVFAPEKNPEGHAEFEKNDVRKFLSTLGQHPDAYATLSIAEGVYTASVLESTVDADGSISKADARLAAKVGAEVQGTLDQSRTDQIAAEGDKKLEDYQKSLEKRSAWIEFGTTAAIAAGVAFLPATAAAAGTAAILVPLAVDTGTGVLETTAGNIITDWGHKSEEDFKDATEKATGEKTEEVWVGGDQTAKSPVKHFLDQHESVFPEGDQFPRDLVDDVDLGYGLGCFWENRLGNDPEIEKDK